MRDETGATAANNLGAVTGTLDGPANGGLALASLPGLSNSSTQVSAFNQVNSTTLSGLTGGPQQFTLTFTWAGNTSSNNGINGGDESAILLGLDTNINGDVGAADDYPGTNCRTEAGDGHFVSITGHRELNFIGCDRSQGGEALKDPIAVRGLCGGVTCRRGHGVAHDVESRRSGVENTDRAKSKPALPSMGLIAEDKRAGLY